MEHAAHTQAYEERLSALEIQDKKLDAEILFHKEALARESK